MTTAQVYYTTDSLHGNYQFYPLSDIIDEMLLNTELNNDSYIKNKPMRLIMLHAKNGVNDLTFDMANDVLGLELEIGDDLQFIFPQDYLDWVRVSLVNENGDLLTLNENRTNNKATTYLQANDYSIMFSNAGEVLEADGQNAFNKPFERKIICPTSNGVQFQTDTSQYSKYGEFIVDKQRGALVFDSTIARKTVVLEYISDGLQASNIRGEDLKVHKYFREPLVRWIEWQLINGDVNVPERQKMRAERLYRGAKQKAYSRTGNIKLFEISKAFRSSLKWIKT